MDHGWVVPLLLWIAYIPVPRAFCRCCEKGGLLFPEIVPGGLATVKRAYMQVHPCVYLVRYPGRVVFERRPLRALLKGWNFLVRSPPPYMRTRSGR